MPTLRAGFGPVEAAAAPTKRLADTNFAVKAGLPAEFLPIKEVVAIAATGVDRPVHDIAFDPVLARAGT